MNRTFVSGALTLIAAIVALVLPGTHIPAAFQLDPNMAGAAGKVVGCLVVVALLLERALASFNDLLFGQERSDARQQLAIAHAPAPSGAAAAPVALAPVLRALEQVDSKRERFRLVMGLAAGFVISAAGVRTLAALVTGPPAFTPFQTIVDICLTAGLLAGGSNGLSKLIDVLQESAGQKLNALRRNA